MAASVDAKKWAPLFWPLMILDYLLGIVLGLLYDESPPDPQSVAVGDATPTRSAARRSPGHTAEFVSAHEGATTVSEMIQRGVKKFGDLVAMQHFEFIELKKLKPTDKFPSKVFGENLVQLTYQQFGECIENFGRGLRSLGMEPQPATSSLDEFNTAEGKFAMVIFEDTCKEWTIALQGALSQSMVVATCYATLGCDAVIAAVNEASATTLFVNWKQAERFYKRVGEMPSLTTIVASTHEFGKGGKVWKPEERGKVKVVSYDEVLDMGKKSNEASAPLKPNDVAVIMYTSGSTGKPKGVVMRHSHLVAGLAGMVLNVRLREGEEVYVSYLPLAHILALQIENTLLSVGARMCYSDPRQLALVMPKFMPTVFVGVPKVWELLQAGLTKKIGAGPKPVGIVFNILLDWKMSMLKQGKRTPVSDVFFGLICKKITGRKRLEYGVTGGGPMSASLQLFCRAIFNCPIVQGYALTETCVGGCFQNTKDQRPGLVGPPAPCVEVMVQSEPDFQDTAGLSYLHTDTKGAKGEPVLGRGEICFRGPSISAGYYKLPEKTAEDFDSEGFFHTGDIGQFTADGALMIVDRKKNLVKLKGGEYVAIEAMECAFAASPYATMLMVIANGDLDTPLAVVCTDDDALARWAGEAGVAFSSPADLAGKAEARKEVVRSFVAAGKDAGLGKLELRIKDCVLASGTAWVPGQGMTASMKLDRHGVMEIHKKEIKEMFERNGVVITAE